MISALPETMGADNAMLSLSDVAIASPFAKATIATPSRAAIGFFRMRASHAAFMGRGSSARDMPGRILIQSVQTVPVLDLKTHGALDAAYAGPVDSFAAFDGRG